MELVGAICRGSRCASYPVIICAVTKSAAALSQTSERKKEGNKKLVRISPNAVNILTEISQVLPKAVALASYLGDGYSQSLNRTPSKDLMAFGSVLQHTQHNIGTYGTSRESLGLPQTDRISHLPTCACKSQTAAWINSTRIDLFY